MTAAGNTQQEIVARLRELPTAAVSDALDQAGIEGALHGVAPLSDDFRAVGPAFTVRYAPIDDTVGGTVGDFLNDVPPGAVIVIDNDGRTDVTVWGGIMTEIAAVRGIARTVMNGACRHVSACLAQNYPLFSCGRFMRTSKDRVAWRSPVSHWPYRASRFSPAPSYAPTPTAWSPSPPPRRADHRDRRTNRGIEAGIAAAARAGSSLRAARERLGYHTLQTRQP